MTIFDSLFNKASGAAKKKGFGVKLSVKFGGSAGDRKRCKICGRIESAHFDEDHKFKEKK